MAYNVLKGVIEGSVDQYADQEIDGIKIFKNTISASVFYDTDAQSPCATLKDVAIKKIKGGTPSGVLVCDAEAGAQTDYSFTYADKTLSVDKIKAKQIAGNAQELYNIPADKFSDKITANFIVYNYGLQDVGGRLQVKAADGLKCDDDGIGIDLMPSNCLAIKHNKLVLNPDSAESITKDGQNLSDDDLIIVSDVSSGTVKKSKLANLYSSYLNLKVPHASGEPGTIQFKGKKEFESSNEFRYDKKTNTVEVDGRLRANTLVSKGKLTCEGAVYHNIVTVTDTIYNVSDYDYTIVCDASNNRITINLPPPQNNKGRVIIVKKANKDKYKINSNLVSITCAEGVIDINNKTEIKMNFSTKTFQSDGNNWWIIGTYGN
jgi:hypothetical protein